MISIKNMNELGEARLNNAKLSVNKIFKNKLELDKLKELEQYVQLDEINKKRRQTDNKNADEIIKSYVTEVKKNVEILELVDRLLLKVRPSGRPAKEGGKKKPKPGEAGPSETTTTTTPTTTKPAFSTGDPQIREYIEKILRVKNSLKSLLQKVKKNIKFYVYFDKIDIDDMRNELQILDNINKNLIDKFTSQIPAVSLSPESRESVLLLLSGIRGYIEEIYNIISGGGSGQYHFIKIGGSKLYNTSIVLDNYKYV